MKPTPFDIDGFGDDFIEEPPAPEPPGTIIPPEPHETGPTPSEQFIRDFGHRAAIAGTLVLVAAVAAILTRLGIYWTLLLIAFVAADLALLCGVIASWRQRRRLLRDREPLGLIIFSLLLLIPTLALVVLAKQDRLDALISAVTGK